jgi:hypothetical protein
MSNHKIVEVACGAICIMAINVENQIRFGDAGGCSLLLEVIRFGEYQNHADVIGLACVMMRKLGSNDENQIKLVAGGGCELLLEVLREYYISNPMYGS